jgi:hypothetical protein
LESFVAFYSSQIEIIGVFVTYILFKVFKQN